LSDALVLAASIVAILVITVVQERRTQRALEALRELSSPHALVLRDGVEKRIPGIEVVRGDLLILREGDRVAADGVVSNPHAFEVDESLATGESLPVRKPAASSVVSGSLVVRGSAAVQVTATGPRSELGRIGVSLATIEGRATPLQVETARMVRRMALVALALCVFFALAFATLRGDWIGGILAGLTLAMSLLPEEFPVVLTVFLALGAWRLSRFGVLTRRMPSIEMLRPSRTLRPSTSDEPPSVYGTIDVDLTKPLPMDDDTQVFRREDTELRNPDQRSDFADLPPPNPKSKS